MDYCRAARACGEVGRARSAVLGVITRLFPKGEWVRRFAPRREKAAGAFLRAPLFCFPAFYSLIFRTAVASASRSAGVL
jgi:hypothetical protein